MESNYDKYLTPEVLHKLMRRANKLAQATDGDLDAGDLLNQAWVDLIHTYGERLHEPGFKVANMLNYRMRRLMSQWRKGHPRKPHIPSRCAMRHRHVPFHDFAGEDGKDKDEDLPGFPHPLAIKTFQNIAHMILKHDVERAIAQLCPQDQALVRVYMRTEPVQDRQRHELSYRQAAERLGWKPDITRWRWLRARRKLRALLAEYAPHDERTQTETSQAAPLRTA